MCLQVNVFTLDATHFLRNVYKMCIRLTPRSDYKFGLSVTLCTQAFNTFSKITISYTSLT